MEPAYGLGLELTDEQWQTLMAIRQGWTEEDWNQRRYGQSVARMVETFNVHYPELLYKVQHRERNRALRKRDRRKK